MPIPSVASRWRLRTLLTVLAIALGVWLAGGSTAEATCGDYLDHSAYGMMQGHENAADLKTEETGPAPCDGPDCRRAPELPALPVPPTPPTFAGERWACLSCPPPVTPRSAGRLIPDDEPLLPGGTPFALERPPRSMRLVAPAIEA